MQLRGRGNVIAIALSGLAVVLAASGTAVAVTAATTVNIADPATATHVAKVDAFGRLSANGPTSQFNSYSYLQDSYTTAVTSPTTARLEVSRVAIFNNEGNTNYANSEFIAYLYKMNVDSSGNCSNSDSQLAGPYSVDRVAVGTNTQDQYTVPLSFAPTGSTKYCIGIALDPEGTAPNGYYLPTAQVTGYSIAGSYTGIGTGSAIAAARPRALRLHKGT